MTGHLAKAARIYASRLGWRVHPLRPGDKRPLLSKWQERASAAPEQAAAWWQETSDANIGIATGPDSGIFVLDVDGAGGERSLFELERTHGPLPEMYPMQWTGGGWQAFFAWPEGRNVRNSAGRLGNDLDTRGAGGYVVVPPSVHPNGAHYRWAEDRNPLDIPPEAAPQWLVDLLDPPEAPALERGKWCGPSSPAGGDKRALKAFRSELALVAAAASGRRNDQLNQSAYNLLRFVKSGDLPSHIVRDALADAANHAGLGPIEAMNTIRSAASARGVDVG